MSNKNYISRRLFLERTGFTKVIPNKKKHQTHDDDIEYLDEEDYEEEVESDSEVISG